MYIGPHEWRRPGDAPLLTQAAAVSQRQFESLYRRLAAAAPDEAARAAGAELLRNEIAALDSSACAIPEAPEDLYAWMQGNAEAVHAKYALYLEARREGGPRRFFRNRAHALHFLRSVSPTKLVDGAWLYGLVQHAANPRLAALVQTYVEELGEGALDKNHVVLYRALLSRYGLEPVDDLPDANFRQGAIQLALAWNAEEFLPEVAGFNLGYEQLPLHLLITAYELNELGIDPYYFQLHVTVDNAGTGHARRACDAVLELLPQADDGGVFWERVRRGAMLADAGVGTMDVIDGFDIDAEVTRILARKAAAGAGAHSDYCRVGGRSVNDWLKAEADVPQFLQALEAQGWIRRGEAPAESRFWRLLQGERAEMFGVFSSYELQVIHDWIRADAGADGAAYTEVPPAPGRRRPTFRALQRHAPESAPAQVRTLADPDLAVLEQQLAEPTDPATRLQRLVEAMSPARHWTPAGLRATQVFWKSRSAAA